MFENFSFDAEPVRSISPPYSPRTMIETEVSPFFKPENLSITSAPMWTTGYVSPPPTPPESRTTFRLRAPSITSTLENLTIRERQSAPPSPPMSTSSLDSGDSVEHSNFNSVRFQRQMLSRLHIEEAQRRCLADLVEDMISTGQSCHVSTWSSSPSSPLGCDDADEEHKFPSSSSFRKSWTFGATQGCVNGGGCVRAGVQKKPRMRRSLVALHGDRMVSKRTKATK